MCLKVNPLQGICDGAGVVIVASEKACSEHNLIPLARLVAYDVVGVDPTIMGIGPAYSIQNVLKKAQMTLDNIDLVEVIEDIAYYTREKEPLNGFNTFNIIIE